jgi:segregation and condensation protein B
MYATTRDFLDYFNLKSLDQLPALAEIRDFDTLTAELGFEPIPELSAESGEAESAPDAGTAAGAEQAEGENAEAGEEAGEDAGESADGNQTLSVDALREAAQAVTAEQGEEPVDAGEQRDQGHG